MRSIKLRCIMCLPALSGWCDADWGGDQRKVKFKSSNAACSSAHPTHVTAAPCGPRPVTSHWDKKETWAWSQLPLSPCDTCRLEAGHREADWDWAPPAVRRCNDCIDTGELGYWGRLGLTIVTCSHFKDQQMIRKLTFKGAVQHFEKLNWEIFFVVLVRWRFMTPSHYVTANMHV